MWVSAVSVCQCLPSEGLVLGQLLPPGGRLSPASGEQHGDAVVVADLAGSPQLEQPGQAGRTGGVDRDPGRRPPPAGWPRPASPRSRPAAGRRSAACPPPRPASRRSRRRGCRSPRCAGCSSQGCMNADRCAAALAMAWRTASGPGSSGSSARTRCVGPFQRMGAERLHGVDAGQSGPARPAPPPRAAPGRRSWPALPRRPGRSGDPGSRVRLDRSVTSS